VSLVYSSDEGDPPAAVVSPVERDKQFRDVIWSSALSMLRAYGRRYGYCVDIKVIKDDPRTITDA
jgi:hypothetical protein